jgi:hypothetical protein
MHPVAHDLRKYSENTPRTQLYAVNAILCFQPACENCFPYTGYGYFPHVEVLNKQTEKCNE